MPKQANGLSCVFVNMSIQGELLCRIANGKLASIQLNDLRQVASNEEAPTAAESATA
jgi:hypothetical protein